MDSSVSLKDQIWFLCVCHHIPFSLYYNRSPPTRTPRKPVLDWTDTPADINGLVRFAERPNLVSVRVPSHSVFTLPSTVCMVIIFTSWTFHYEGIFPIVSFFFIQHYVTWQRHCVVKCLFFFGGKFQIIFVWWTPSVLCHEHQSVTKSYYLFVSERDNQFCMTENVRLKSQRAILNDAPKLVLLL